MNDHERLYIDVLVHEACDLVCQTAIQRLEGPTNVLRKLREDPDGEGIWLGRFVGMFLAERALDGEAGACAILESLARRPMPSVEGTTIGDTLKAAARAAFADMVRLKADEALELASSQEATPRQVGARA